MGGVYGWVEDGQRHSLPVPDNFDSITTHPGNRLALAFNYFVITGRSG
jgi:hypothetical protein